MEGTNCVSPQEKTLSRNEMTNYTMTSGAGIDKHKLVSFDKALLSSRIANYNIVKVSSILPPGCNPQIEVSAAHGSVLFTAYASISSCNEELLSAAIGVGIPTSAKDVGVIMEYSCREGKATAEETVREMVKASMDLRNIDIQEIKVVSAEAKATCGEFTTVIAALAMW